MCMGVLSICLSVDHVLTGDCGGWRGDCPSDPLKLEFQIAEHQVELQYLPCECWEPNPSHLQEHSVLLTAETSPQDRLFLLQETIEEKISLILKYKVYKLETHIKNNQHLS